MVAVTGIFFLLYQTRANRPRRRRRIKKSIYIHPDKRAIIQLTSCAPQRAGEQARAIRTHLKMFFRFEQILFKNVECQALPNAWRTFWRKRIMHKLSISEAIWHSSRGLYKMMCLTSEAAAAAVAASYLY
jgi:hypothetical protein